MQRLCRAWPVLAAVWGRVVVDLSVKIDAADALKALDAISDPSVPRQIAEKVANDVVLPNLAKYPRASGKKQPFRSDKSRRFFFAALADGAMEVPYQRSGDTGASYEKQNITDGIALVSSLPSAEYTRGPGQAAYHKGNWPTHAEIAAQSEGDAALVATAVLVEIIGDAGP